MKCVAWLIVIFALTSVAMPAVAEEQGDSQLFAQAATLLQQGAIERAISAFESLADRGFVHPDASYDRGLAYLGRVRAHEEQPGDLGRAAAAFEECLMSRPGDSAAEDALDKVRAEVASRRIQRGGAQQVQPRPTIDRVIVGLLPERIWAACALVGALVLTLGLLARKSAKAAVHLGAVTAIPIGAVVLALAGPATGMARYLRHTTRTAVVVAPEVRMTDEHGAIMPGDPIPEAAKVEQQQTAGDRTSIRYGGKVGWVPAESLRVLAGP